MMELNVQLEPGTDEGTFGKATLLGEDGDPVASWDYLTLPEPYAIGRFRAVAYASPHFKRDVYLLQDVPGHDYIELHPLNWAGREPEWYSDSRGCMGIGNGRGVLTPPATGKPQHCILDSTAALNELLRLTAGLPIMINISAAA